jgi:hypothetical protein
MGTQTPSDLLRNELRLIALNRDCWDTVIFQILDRTEIDREFGRCNPNFTFLLRTL